MRNELSYYWRKNFRGTLRTALRGYGFQRRLLLKNCGRSEIPQTKYSGTSLKKSLLSNNQNFASSPCRAIFISRERLKGVVVLSFIRPEGAELKVSSIHFQRELALFLRRTYHTRCISMAYSEATYLKEHYDQDLAYPRVWYATFFISHMSISRYLVQQKFCSNLSIVFYNNTFC